MVNEIDVLYKADLSRPSDTRYYYEGYMAPWNQIGAHIFSEYPYFLRSLTYPFRNALFAVWGQSVLLFLLVDIIVRNKRNLFLFITLHALIYTTTNLFKDNLILLIGLGSYIILERVRKVWIQCLIIYGAIGMMAWVRPFLGLALPVGLYPLLFRIRSTRIKHVLLSCCVIGFVIVLYLQRDFIEGVMNSFADDSSVAEGRSSVPVAVIKVVLGPTPIHYLFSQSFFVQPFLFGQSVYYAILHCFYYFSFSFFCVYLISNYKIIFNLYKASIARVFMLLLAMIQLFVYVVVYGSADVRQRGIILSFLFIFCLVDKPVFKRYFTRNQFVCFCFIVSALTILTCIG